MWTDCRSNSVSSSIDWSASHNPAQYPSSFYTQLRFALKFRISLGQLSGYLGQLMSRGYAARACAAMWACSQASQTLILSFCVSCTGERRTAEVESCTTGEELAALILKDRWKELQFSSKNYFCVIIPLKKGFTWFGLFFCIINRRGWNSEKLSIFLVQNQNLYTCG